MSKTERRPRLTAARKLELYLATRSADAPLGEILRQYGVHLDDLRAIERVVESSALAGLKAQSRHGRQPTDVTPERVQQLERELAEKTRALAELGVSFALLEKKDRAESRSRSQAKGSRPEERQVILDLIVEAKADGLPTKRACEVLGLSPRTVQRWQASASLFRPWPPRRRL